MQLFNQNKSLLALVVTSAALVGCGDASSGAGASNDSSPTEITVEKTSEQIESISSNIANCSESSSASAALSAIKTSHIQNVIQTSKVLSQSTGKSKVVIQPSAASSGCTASPGTVAVDSEHSNGDTAYELTFNAYCFSGAQGDTIVTGIVNATEDGTPSDHGPVISALDMDTNELQVNYTDDDGANQTAEITLSGARTQYGKPAAWSPDTPTSDQPDTTKIGNLKIDVTTTGETHQIKDLTMTRHGGNSATVEITSGTYRSPQGDVVSLSTPSNEPLQVNVNQGDLTSGTIVMTGANNTRAEISATNSDRVVAVEVNGSPIKQLDCANADDTISDFAGVLVNQLPVH